MQFDQSFVAIRSRGTLELFDLALIVVRRYWRPILTLLILGAAPLTAVDWVMIRLFVGSEDLGELARLEGWAWMLLILNQAQIGTILISHYLGQVVFTPNPRALSSIPTVVNRIGGILWLHFVLRGAAAPFLLLWLGAATPHVPDKIAVTAWIGIVTGIACLVCTSRPFANEILVLERLPFFKQNRKTDITFARRSKLMHTAAASNSLGKGILCGLVAAMILSAIYLAARSGLQLAALSLENVRWQDTILWVFALWMTAGFMAVVRFLSYLDLRIRQEGWDVELLIRAEAFRIAKDITANRLISTS